MVIYIGNSTKMALHWYLKYHPSIQLILTLCPKVCKYCLHLGHWDPTQTLKSSFRLSFPVSHHTPIAPNLRTLGYLEPISPINPRADTLANLKRPPPTSDGDLYREFYQNGFTLVLEIPSKYTTNTHVVPKSL